MVRRLVGALGALVMVSGCGLVVGLRGDYVLGDASVDTGTQQDGGGGMDAPGGDVSLDGPAPDTGKPDTGLIDTGIDAPLQCVNMTQDPDESDVDCGGTSPCPRCPQGKKCTIGSDCVSGMCNGANNRCK